MKNGFSIEVFGSSCVLLNWPAEISQSTHSEIVQLDGLIGDHFQELVIETVLGYYSIMVQLKRKNQQQEFINELLSLDLSLSKQSSERVHLFRIPVCYHTSFGLDLKELSEEKKQSIPEIIQLHTQPIYPVYFIGFLPGFPYLGGLVEPLHTPRKSTPRPRIKAGSVGIGGNQTGIYPQDSPGGWNLIGRTPISLFDKNLQQPALLTAGDRVQFYSIDDMEYKRISEAIQNNTFTIEQEVWYD